MPREWVWLHLVGGGQFGKGWASTHSIRFALNADPSGVLVETDPRKPEQSRETGSQGDAASRPEEGQQKTRDAKETDLRNDCRDKPAGCGKELDWWLRKRMGLGLSLPIWQLAVQLGHNRDRKYWKGSSSILVEGNKWAPSGTFWVPARK